MPRDGTANDLGRLLRQWRRARSRSQLDLALSTGVSQRHLSFIESGRSVPSRQTLIALADGLDVPLRDRNALLVAAGYAPTYSAAPWDAAEMDAVSAAARRMLRQHDPFPAVVLDRRWTVLMANESAPRLFNRFVDLSARPRPRNLLHLMFDPAGMRPFIADWPAVARGLIQRVYRESVGAGPVDPPIATLLAELMAYPGVDPAWAAPPSPASLPVVPIGFVKDGRVLNYFSMVATVGTPLTIAAQELRLECMFPVDVQAEAHHMELIGTPPAR